MDRAFMNAGPAFVYQGADTAGMAQVFFPEGYDAEVTHDPVGAGVHVARPDLHFSVQSVSGWENPAFMGARTG